MNKRFNILGFTLIELMIVLAIVGIILLYSTPSLRPLVQRTTAEDLKDNLVSALEFARSSAVNRQRLVSICGSSDGTACDRAANQAWEFATVFIGNTAAENTTANRLMVKELASSTANVTTGADLITYQALGQTLGAAVNFSLYDSNGTNLCTVGINASGIINNPNSRCKQP